jgi:hypothetical protein
MNSRTEDIFRRYITELDNMRDNQQTQRERQQQRSGKGNGPTNNEPPAEVSRATVRLPAFWPERPAVWFAQANFFRRCQQREVQILSRYFAAGPTMRRGTGGHHRSTRTKPLHHTKGRAREAADPRERAAHPPAPYTRRDRRP